MKKELETLLPHSFQEAIRQSIIDLKSKNQKSQALQAGGWAPNFVLSTPHGELVSLQSLLHNGPVVVVFYQGGWNPYCNIQLKALQAHAHEIQELGGQLVAISPESPEYGLTTALAHQLSFDVLNDQDNMIAQRYGLNFTIPANLRNVYENLGIDLIQNNRSVSFELPMAATYVIDQERRIAYSFVEEDFSKRAPISDILSVLYDLKKLPMVEDNRLAVYS